MRQDRTGRYTIAGPGYRPRTRQTPDMFGFSAKLQRPLAVAHGPLDDRRSADILGGKPCKKVSPGG
jgi:hypothetical protein